MSAVPGLDAAVGTDVTEWLGVKLWQPPVSATISGAALGPKPSWFPTTDEERIQNIPEILGHRDGWTATEKLDGTSYVLIRQAGESGSLYGSVTARDIAASLTEAGFSVDKGQVVINAPIKTLGLYTIAVVLHPEVDAKITVNVARSAEEAERQARGEVASVREEFNLDDLGLEVGAALAEAGPNAEM
jgi:hypothetical protein